MNKCVIADTSCSIALDRINRLDLLRGLFSTIVTTEEFKEEFGSPLPTWIFIQEVHSGSYKSGKEARVSGNS